MIVAKHNFKLVALLKSRISKSKVDNVIARLGFPFSYWIEAVGFAGGIWLL